ncbi:hypothetical protein CERSUDRAFT_92559 [Gelatoporia subvermispora B]|uniref:Uncharacterized protein n=1 Tax=Ceriporiopsis subvermispora (strain B) TaxID=914234 RepID=M2RMJ1_CERS8|nr:hypothetical protein CERSUDRAFT_92559 [Gelatoporia subvermispora B]
MDAHTIINPFPTADSSIEELLVTVHSYQQALAASQMRCDAMRDDNHRLQEQVDSLTRQVSQLRTTEAPGATTRLRARCQDKAGGFSESEQKAIRKFCKHFTVMERLWIEPSWYQVNAASLTMTMMTDATATLIAAVTGDVGDGDGPAPERLADALRINTMAAFHKMLPSELRERNRVQMEAFAGLWATFSSDQRSTNAFKAREKAHIIFSGVTPQWFMTKKTTDDPIVRANLGRFNDRTSRFSRFPPLFYPNHKRVADKSKLFFNPELPRLLLFVLFSSSALHGKFPGKRANGLVWGIQKLTAGSIAYTLILARFLFSPDATFGDSTGSNYISYTGDFDVYRSMFEAKTPATEAVIHFWETITLACVRANANQMRMSGPGDNSDDSASSSPEDFSNQFAQIDASQDHTDSEDNASAISRSIPASSPAPQVAVGAQTSAVPRTSASRADDYEVPEGLNFMGSLGLSQAEATEFGSAPYLVQQTDADSTPDSTPGPDGGDYDDVVVLAPGRGRGRGRGRGKARVASETVAPRRSKRI